MIALVQHQVQLQSWRLPANPYANDLFAHPYAVSLKITGVQDVRDGEVGLTEDFY